MFSDALDRLLAEVETPSRGGAFGFASVPVPLPGSDRGVYQGTCPGGDKPDRDLYPEGSLNLPYSRGLIYLFILIQDQIYMASTNGRKWYVHYPGEPGVGRRMGEKLKTK